MPELGFVKFTFLVPGRVASWAEIVEGFKDRSRPNFSLQLFNLTTPGEALLLSSGFPPSEWIRPRRLWRSSQPQVQNRHQPDMPDRWDRLPQPGCHPTLK